MGWKGRLAIMLIFTVLVMVYLILGSEGGLAVGIVPAVRPLLRLGGCFGCAGVARWLHDGCTRVVLVACRLPA